MAWIQLPQGDLINADNIATVYPPTGASTNLSLKLNDGTGLNYTFKSSAEAQEVFLSLTRAVIAQSLSLAVFSVTPNTAVAGANFSCIIIGSGFEAGGSINFGGTGSGVVQVNSSTLLVTSTASVVPGVYDVTYTAFDLARTATLVNGFTVT